MDKVKILTQVIDVYTKGNKRQFAMKLGITAQSLDGWFKRNTLDADMIFAKCENINPSFLITGEGPILKTELQTPVADSPVSVSDSSVSDIKILTNELLSVSHTLQELMVRNVAILEKSQQQFDRVLSLAEKITQQQNSNYNIMAAEPDSKNSTENEKD